VRPCLEQHHPWSRANGHNQSAAGNVLPIPGDRHTSALDTVASRAAADTGSSCGAEGSSDSTVLLKDLLEHLRQNFCCWTRGRWSAGHRVETLTDLMFAPSLRAHLARLRDSDSAGRPRTTAECTLETNRNAPTGASRNLNSGSQRRRSLSACSPGRAGIAQQMFDLQKRLQTGARCMARTVSSNLTADSPAVYHPLTEEGSVAGVMQGSRLARGRCGSDAVVKSYRLWTCHVRRRKE
jgi:hypothetical protein